MSVLAVSFSKSISLVPFPIRLIIKHAFCDDAHIQGNYYAYYDYNSCWQPGSGGGDTNQQYIEQ